MYCRSRLRRRPSSSVRSLARPSCGEMHHHHGIDRRRSHLHCRRLGLAGHLIKTLPPPPFRLSSISAPSFALDSAMRSVQHGPHRARGGGTTPTPKTLQDIRVTTRPRHRAVSFSGLRRRRLTRSSHSTSQARRRPLRGLRHESRSQRLRRCHRRRILVGWIQGGTPGGAVTSDTARGRWSVLDLRIHRRPGGSCGGAGAAAGKKTFEKLASSAKSGGRRSEDIRELVFVGSR